MVETITWIDVKEQLPPDNTWQEQYLVTVYCETWKGKYKTMVMDWECTTVRGVEVKRWKYLGRLVSSLWKVTHWAEYPKPAITGQN